MSCVVKGCKNRSDRKKKNPGITFHRFSRENEVWKNDWIQIIRNCNGENDWIPNKYSVICSIHFEANDLYTTKGGLRRVVTYAVPQKFLIVSPPIAKEQPVKQKFLIESPPMAEEQPIKQEFLIESAHMVEEQPIKQEFLIESTPMAEEEPVIKQEILIESAHMAEEEPVIKQESAFVIVPALEEPCSSTMVLQEDEQSAEPNISDNLQKKSSETERKQVLTIPYTPRKQCLEQSLIKKQDIIRKQKRKIKTLKQKVTRLQNRNKYLKEILKSLKKKNKLILKHSKD